MPNNPFDNNDFKKNVVDIDLEKTKKKIKKIVPIILIILIVGYLIAGSVYVLEDRENGVVLRFGKVHNVVTTSGLNFKMPFADKVEKVDVRTIHSMEYGYRTEVSGSEASDPVYRDQSREATVIVDGANNNASIGLIELIIQYRVDDPVSYLFNVDDVEGTLRLALEDTVRTTVQAFTIEEARTEKESISKEVLPQLQRKMEDYGSGIKITMVATQNFQFLPTVETALQEQENANQYKNGKKEDAEKYYNTVIPQANAEATKLVEEANGYKATVIANANAGVAEFNALYQEYVNNPQILKQRYYLDAMSEFLSNNKIIVDGTNGDNLYKFYNMDGNSNTNTVKQRVIENEVSE